MIESLSNNVTNQATISKKFEEWNISLNQDSNSISISINQNDSYNIYESYFPLEFLIQFNLFKSSDNIKNIFEYISNSIDKNNLKIKVNQDNLKLILFSTLINYSNVELNLKQKRRTSEEIIELLINDMQKLKNQNNILTKENERINQNLQSLNSKNDELSKNVKNLSIQNEELSQNVSALNFKYILLNQKLKSIKSKNEELTLNIKSNSNKLEKQNQKLESLRNQNLELEQKIEIFEVENNLIKNEVTTQRLEMNQEKNKIHLNEGKMNEIEQKLKKLDSFHSIETRSSISSPQLIKTITPHENSINSVNIFPSGNIISVSDDKSIKIYDNFFNLLQTIKLAHYCGILYVDIKDDNNFMTCSVDRSIKTWIKINNKFQINHRIYDAHNNMLWKVKYYSDKFIISCSWDNCVKIWRLENNNEYQCISTIKHTRSLYSILTLEDKGMFISSGEDGSKIWNMKKLECVKLINDCYSYYWNGLERLNKDKVIFGGGRNGIMKIYSISEFKVVKEINNTFCCCGIGILEKKNLFFVGGKSEDIRVYNSENFECVKIIKSDHEDNIFGFVPLKDGSIASFSKDKNIKVWSINIDIE